MTCGTKGEAELSPQAGDALNDRSPQPQFLQSPAQEDHDRTHVPVAELCAERMDPSWGQRSCKAETHTQENERWHYTAKKSKDVVMKTHLLL